MDANSTDLQMTRSKVVYLLGAGATQAALNIVDDTRSVLMRHIAAEVFLRIRRDQEQELYALSNAIQNEGTDIEHVITLLESSIDPSHRRMSRSLRRLFKNEIGRGLGEFSSHLHPNLLAALFDLHNVEGFDEELIGVLSLNYDQIAELGFAEVFDGVHYLVELKSEHSNLALNNKLPAFIKLHGSFNWRNRFPLALVDEENIGPDDVLWIPPGLTKSRDHYPFDLLWGHAHELLRCDILRIVGCSLSPNDMHLVSLIFRTQIMAGQDSGYSIEIINNPRTCESIADRYQYLDVTGIMDQADFVLAVASDIFSGIKSLDDIDDAKKNVIRKHLDGRGVNILARWLQMKAENLLLDTNDIATERNILAKYLGLEDA